MEMVTKVRSGSTRPVFPIQVFPRAPACLPNPSLGVLSKRVWFVVLGGLIATCTQLQFNTCYAVSKKHGTRGPLFSAGPLGLPNRAPLRALAPFSRQIGAVTCLACGFSILSQ